MQLLERGDFSIFFKHISQVGHGGCLVLAQLSIAVGIPVGHAKRFHLGVGKLDNIQPFQDLKFNVIEIEHVAVRHGRQVEGYGVHLLAILLLGHIGSDDDFLHDFLPLGGCIDVAEKIPVVIVAGHVVCLGEHCRRLVSPHTHSEPQHPAAFYPFFGLDEELAVPACYIPFAFFNLVAGLVGLDLAAHHNLDTVVGGIFRVFHDVGGAIELLFHCSPFMHPETGPVFGRLAFQVAVLNQIDKLPFHNIEEVLPHVGGGIGLLRAFRDIEGGLVHGDILKKVLWDRQRIFPIHDERS